MNPVYTYSTTGTFSVTLTVSNTLGIDSISQSLGVLPYVPLQTINLQLRDSPPFLTGDLIDFQADLTPIDASKPYTYTINHGDSSGLVTASTRYDPFYFAHRYSISGAYTATISAWNNGMPVPVSATLQLDIFQRERADLYLPTIYIHP
jgi:PKD repeat protein